MKRGAIALGPAVITIVALLVACPASAGFTGYTDETAWLSDVGALDATEDFSGFAVDTEFRSSARDVTLAP